MECNFEFCYNGYWIPLSKHWLIVTEKKKYFSWQFMSCRVASGSAMVCYRVVSMSWKAWITPTPPSRTRQSAQLNSAYSATIQYCTAANLKNIPYCYCKHRLFCLWLTFDSYQLFTITGYVVTVPDYWSIERRWATRTSSWLCWTWEAAWTLTARATLGTWCGWGTVTKAANSWLTSWAGGWVNSTNSFSTDSSIKIYNRFPVFASAHTDVYQVSVLCPWEWIEWVDRQTDVGRKVQGLWFDLWTLFNINKNSCMKTIKFEYWLLCQY